MTSFSLSQYPPILLQLLLMFLSLPLATHAQYGEPVQNPSVLEDFPGEEVSTSTAVIGQAGDLIPVETVAGMSEMTVTLKNGVSGTLDVGVVSSEQLPGVLPEGDSIALYAMDFDGFSKNDVEIELTVKVPQARIAAFDVVEGYEYNSPPQSVNLISQGTDANNNTLFEVGSNSYEALAIMGQDNVSSSNLIRSGGELIKNNYFLVSTTLIYLSVLIFLEMRRSL